MDAESQFGTESPASPLTRADVELLRSRVESSAQLDLSFQNLKQINLSYMDLQGINLRGANLQGANLCGTNLSEANLQEANLSEADLDGADLSRAHLGDSETNRVDLYHAKLSYAALRGLDLRRFDLTELDLRNADLNGSDLRDALLRGSDLCGADLSTALLHGPELRGAILYRNAHFGEWLQGSRQGATKQKELAAGGSTLSQERPLLMQKYAVKQPEKTLSDREAYLLGEHTLAVGSDPVKIRLLFPQGFNFADARRLFDAWLTQLEDRYNEKEIHAMWIGFAYRLCDLYYTDEAEE